MELARVCNRYVDDRAPWKSIKSDPTVTSVTLPHLFHFNALKFLGVVLEPHLPESAEKIARMLGPCHFAQRERVKVNSPIKSALARSPRE